MIPSEFCASQVLATCATAGTATTNTIVSIAASSIDFLNLSRLVILSRSLVDRSRSLIVPEGWKDENTPPKSFAGKPTPRATVRGPHTFTRPLLGTPF